MDFKWNTSVTRKVEQERSTIVQNQKCFMKEEVQLLKAFLERVRTAQLLMRIRDPELNEPIVFKSRCFQERTANTYFSAQVPKKTQKIKIKEKFSMVKAASTQKDNNTMNINVVTIYKDIRLKVYILNRAVNGKPYQLFMDASMMHDCFICRLPFDQFEHSPKILCIKQQHICCDDCSEKLLQQDHYRCPGCNVQTSRRQVQRFRQYMDWLKEIKHCKEMIRQEKFKASLLPELEEVIGELVCQKFQSQSQFYSQTIKNAESLFEAGKKYAAIVLLKNLIEKHPNQSMYTFIGLGSKREQKGFSQGKSLSWYKEWYKVDNLSAEDLLNHFLLETPFYEGAEKWYQRMTKDHPDNYKLLYGSALNKHNKGNLKGALVDYKRVIQLNPVFSKALYMIAFTVEDQRYTYKFANLCLERQPDNIFAKYSIAIRQSEKERLNSLIQIIQRQPHYLQALKDIGDIYYITEQYQEALKFYTKCAQASQDYLEPIIMIGNCYHFLKNGKTADYFTKLLERQLPMKEKSQILFLLGMFTNNIQKAIIYLKQSLDVDPLNCKAKIQLAECYQNIAKEQFALTIYKDALKLDEKNTKIFDGITQCCLKLNKHNEAITNLKKWKKIEPENTAIDQQLGQVYYSLKDWKNSLQSYLFCKRQDYYNTSISKMIINNYQNLRDYENALKQLGQHMNRFELSSKEYDSVVERIGEINKARKKQK